MKKKGGEKNEKERITLVQPGAVFRAVLRRRSEAQELGSGQSSGFRMKTPPIAT
jgi:hypothetical protein